VEGGRRPLFWFALQSQSGVLCGLPHGVVGRRKKAGGGRCGIEIEAALAAPVFGQTQSIEVALGVVCSASRKDITSWLRSTSAFAYLADCGFTGAADKPSIVEVEAVAFPHGRIGRHGKRPHSRSP
jgi:hypothetical protein